MLKKLVSTQNAPSLIESQDKTIINVNLDFLRVTDHKHKKYVQAVVMSGFNLNQNEVDAFTMYSESDICTAQAMLRD